MRALGVKDTPTRQLIGYNVHHGLAAGERDGAPAHLGAAIAGGHARSGHIDRYGCAHPADLRQTRRQHLPRDGSPADDPAPPGAEVIPLSAATVTKRTVTVGQRAYSLAAGRSTTITVSLGCGGKALLRKFRRVPLRAAVTLTGLDGRTRTAATSKRVTVKR